MTVPDSFAAALAGTYRIERELGSGGMATVFLAEDLRHRRKVAIKVLHPELSAVIGSDRFLKEIELTANLQHPHILPLFDSGDVSGQLFYVMPFVDGETLRTRLDREQQLPVADAVRIAREVADALAYAHKRGVVHRDIKPENVLLQDGHALVADFGIALAVQQAGAGRLTQTGLSLGTPQYMSPEQAMGERVIDLRADVYALGAVTYEMLAGEPPFTGPTAQAIIARAMTERPRDLLTVRETLPASVNQAVMTALAKLPADRFSSASEFADALTLDGTMATRSAAPSVPGARKRLTWQPWAALAAGLVLGAIAMRAVPGRPTGHAASADAPRFWSIALPDSAPFVGATDPLAAYVRSLDISADGARVVWTTMRGANPELWQLRTDLGTMAPLPGTTGSIIPTFSPDGKSLAFVSNAEVSRMDLASNATARVGMSHGYLGSSNALIWPSPDRILVWNYLGCVESAPATGGNFARLPKVPCGILSAAAGASPGRLAVSTGEVGFLDEATGRVQFVRRAGSADTSASTLVAGALPMQVGDALVFVDDSTMYGAKIDVKNARLMADPRQLLTGIRHEAWGGGVQIALSASGTLVWVAGGDAGVSRFVFVRPGASRADTLPTVPANVNSFALSHDGSRLAYTVSLPGGRSVLHLFDIRRGIDDVTRFAAGVEVNDWADSDTVLTARIGQRRIVLRGLGGTVRIDSTIASYASMSRDASMRCYEGKLWRADSPRDSIRFNKTANWCRFSPDGKYVSWDEEDGLMIAPTTPNAASLRRRIGPPGANEPRWSADGREVLYRTGNRWYAVPSNPAAGKPLPAPRTVLQGNYNQAWASWDLAPDGRLLLLQGPPPARATHLNVITNFPGFVEEKLKAGAP